MRSVTELRDELYRHNKRMWQCKPLLEVSTRYAISKEGGVPARLIYELFELLYELRLADVIDAVRMCYNLDSAFRDTLNQAIRIQDKAKEGMINGGEQSRT